VALWGGIAVFLSLVAGLVASLQMPPGQTATFVNFTGTLLVSASMVFLLGFVDDCYDLAGRLKLTLQIVAVAPIILTGHWCDQVMIFGQAIHLGYCGIPLTALWLVGCLNALNLLDGMDGCASVVGLVAAAAAAVVAQTYGQVQTMPVAAALVGSLAGFLYFNRPQATIYLGDTGSTVIGLVVGLLSLEGGSNAQGQLAFAVPLVLMTIPVWDTTLAIVRRKLTGRRFDAADRGHLHHRLLEVGFTPWQALSIIAALSTVTGVAAIAAARTGRGYLGWGTALAVVVALARLRWFGDYEFSLLKASLKRPLQTIAERLAVASAIRPKRHMAIEHADFSTAWTQLIQELSNCSVRRFEFRFWHQGDLRAEHLWNSDVVVPLHVWRMSMRFEIDRNQACELIAHGGLEPEFHRDRAPRVARLLQDFGRHWATHSEQVSERSIQMDLPITADGVGLQRRSAA
jgi:UDP-GlcNAc:undecaprenyl-phosphate GlcNAc-1-phosphate transferase